jgi:hypothetical protein
MNSIRYICAAAASIVLCSGWIAFADEENAGEKPPVMFVQSAEGASIKDGKLTLMSPSTTFFFAKTAGQMPCSKFIQAWSSGDQSFKNNPPKAVLAVTEPNGESKKMDVSLQNPRFEGPNLVYEVNFVKGSAPDGMDQAALFMNDIRLASFAACQIYHCQVNGG